MAGTNVATITTTYKDDSGDTVTIKETTITQPGMFDIEEAGIDASTLKTIAVPVTLSTLKSMAMGIAKSSGQAANLTALASVYVNDDSGGSPSKTILLTATNGIGWSYGDTSAVTGALARRTGSKRPPIPASSTIQSTAER